MRVVGEVRVVADTVREWFAASELIDQQSGAVWK